jgi:Mg-chelatase subunit ChlD
MSRRLWSPCVALLAACAALAAVARRADTAPAPVYEKPSVEVVFCIDTTGSMGTWIGMCQNKMWAVCNAIAGGKPTPNLKVGLVDFRDKGDLWITKVYDLSDDLDGIYSNLLTFRADGGGDTPESVNQALYDSVHKIKWSKDKKTLRLIFLIGDAPPHMDYTDDVKYPITCKEAVKRGIIINTIQCGTDTDCTKYWKEIASLAGGSYVKIEQATHVKTHTTTHDRRLREINAELAKTILVWGSGTKRDTDAKKARETAGLTDAIAADRLSYFVKEGRTATYDLLDSMRFGKVRYDSLKIDDLPSELQKLDAKERREFLLKVSRARTALLREARELDRKRNADLARELAKDKGGLDYQVREMLRNQGKRARLRY